MQRVIEENKQVVIFFFFQAEDGIRDYKVTGVQRVLFRSLFLLLAVLGPFLLYAEFDDTYPKNPVSVSKKDIRDHINHSL